MERTFIRVENASQELISYIDSDSLLVNGITSSQKNFYSIRIHTRWGKALSSDYHQCIIRFGSLVEGFLQKDEIYHIPLYSYILRASA